MKRVLVLGGGFAGVETAIYLRKEGFEVTLVSERDYLYVYPTAIWIPTGVQSFERTCLSLEGLGAAHGFDVVVDAVASIEAKRDTVTLVSGAVMQGYDYTVVAMGASKMRHPGIENSLSICGAPEQSLLLKERLEALVIQRSGKIAMGFGGNPKDSSAVRGGPGFELMFNVDHHLRKLGIREQFELTMFAPMEEPGKRMGPQALEMMDLFFGKLGIDRRFGTKIKGFESNGVRFEDGSLLEADLTMFIPAGDGHEVIKASDLPQNDAGFVTIDDDCRIRFDDADGPQHWYAVGDVAALEGPDWRAKQGHIAEVMARNTAFNIAAHSRGDTARKGYAEHINILCVMDSGNGAAFVYRDGKRGMMIPMPFVGHWLKKGWGWYYRNSKFGKMFRLPGM
jgi:sulfide:quinone oxidoreductase